MNCKFIVLFCAIIFAICIKDSFQDQCTSDDRIYETEISRKWIDMEDECAAKIHDQIREELTASLTYLVMSAHFAGDRTYRPGLSGFFLLNSIEERNHAKILIDYHQMRGYEIKQTAIPSLVPKATQWKSAKDALTMALAMEEAVTANITSIISKCEGVEKKDGSGIVVNDYHAADYLTGLMLGEQYKSMREISGLLSKLAKMTKEFGDLGELVFDKDFLKA